VGDRYSKPTTPHHIHNDKTLATSVDGFQYRQAIGGSTIQLELGWVIVHIYGSKTRERVQPCRPILAALD
jgi:hypothetical protein